MRNALFLLCGFMLGGPSVLASFGARAEDFTGFYAGVNAGYGFGRDREKQLGSAAGPSAGLDSDHALPPSAARASGAVQDAFQSRSQRSSH